MGERTARLLDGLLVGQGVGDDDQTRLAEGTGDVVGKGTGGEAAGNGLGTGKVGKLEGRTLSVGAGRDDTDIGRVLDRGNDAGGKHELFPGLANVDDVDSIFTALPAVGGHGRVQVLQSSGVD